MEPFVNESKHKFSDISSELRRTYDYGHGKEVTIDLPLKLAVTKGGHRLFDSDGNSHYVPSGWIHLYWQVKDGQPNFVL